MYTIWSELLEKNILLVQNQVYPMLLKLWKESVDKHIKHKFPIQIAAYNTDQGMMVLSSHQTVLQLWMLGHINNSLNITLIV